MLLAITMGTLTLAAFSGSAYCQSSGNVVAFTDNRNFSQSVRALDASINPVYPTLTGADENSVNVKAVRDFKNRFAAPASVRWYPLENGSIAYFPENGYNTRVYYNKKGRWEGTLTLFNEDKLPKDIRAIVKSTYFDFSITVVEMVETPANGVYLVHIEDKTSIKIIRVTLDGEMDVMEDLQKA